MGDLPIAWQHWVEEKKGHSCSRINHATKKSLGEIGEVVQAKVWLRLVAGLEVGDGHSCSRINHATKKSLGRLEKLFRQRFG